MAPASVDEFLDGVGPLLPVHRQRRVLGRAVQPEPHAVVKDLQQVAVRSNGRPSESAAVKPTVAALTSCPSSRCCLVPQKVSVVAQKRCEKKAAKCLLTSDVDAVHVHTFLLEQRALRQADPFLHLRVCRDGQAGGLGRAGTGAESHLPCRCEAVAFRPGDARLVCAHST